MNNCLICLVVVSLPALVISGGAACPAQQFPHSGAGPDGIYKQLLKVADSGACCEACSQDAVCKAWTYQGKAKYTDPGGGCKLRNVTCTARPNHADMISGNMGPGTPTPPPPAPTPATPTPATTCNFTVAHNTSCANSTTIDNVKTPVASWQDCCSLCDKHGPDCATWVFNLNAMPGKSNCR